MRVRIRKTTPDGEVGMREMLVKAFKFQVDEARYFIVKAKSDDAAFHKVRRYLKENKSVHDTSAFWYTTVKKNSDEYTKGYLKAVHLN